MRHASIASALLLLAVACSSAPPPKPLPVLDVPKVKVAAAVVDTTSWAKDWPKTWTDARVIDALVARCDFEPPANTAEADEMSTPADLLRCTLGYSQGCAPDPCASTTDACEKSCMTTCRDCGGACTTSCSSCKAACTDDTCIRRCAQQSAECKQTCNTTLDRCATADCNKAYAECEKRTRAAFKSNNCAARCTTFDRCRDRCNSAKESQTIEAAEACETRCENTLAPCTQLLCMMRQELGAPADSRSR